jgi:hypothetical protein
MYDINHYVSINEYLNNPDHIIEYHKVFIRYSSFQVMKYGTHKGECKGNNIIT